MLADAWTYSDWVVGTAHIRDVDASWPAPGSRLYHKAGPWPFSVRDSTVVLSCKEPTELVVQPRLWPLGEATVALRLTPVGDGATRIIMAEDFAAGPLRWLRTKVNDLVLHYRNRESLRRLSDIVLRKHAAGQPDGGTGDASGAQR